MNPEQLVDKNIELAVRLGEAEQKLAATQAALRDLYKCKFGNELSWPGDAFHDYCAKHEVALDAALGPQAKETGE